MYALHNSVNAFKLGRINNSQSSESIDSGQVCLTMDSEIDPSGNIGIIDYERGSLKVKYNAQIVFPGMYKLIEDCAN